MKGQLFVRSGSFSRIDIKSLQVEEFDDWKTHFWRMLIATPRRRERVAGGGNVLMNRSIQEVGNAHDS